MGLGITIARRSLVQRPARTIFSVLGVAVGIATVVAVFTLDHNTISSRWKVLSTEWTADLEVHAGRDVEAPRELLTSIDGVVGVTAFFQKDAVLRTTPGSANRTAVRLVGLEPRGSEAIGAYHVIHGTDFDSELEVPQALIGERLAEELGLELGDGFLLSRPRRPPSSVCVEGEQRVVGQDSSPPPEFGFRVVGILAHENLGRRAQGQVVVVGLERGRELFAGQTLDEGYWVQRDPSVDIERLEAALARNFDYRRDDRTLIGAEADERAFRNGVRIAGLLAMVLGLYVIFHTLSMSLVERVREVAVLHALGTTRRQIARVFFSEAVVLAVLSGGLGLGLGLFLARAMLRKGITTLGVTAPIRVFEVPWGVAVSLALTGVGIALLGSVYPLLKARRTDTVSALRGEGLGHTSPMARGFHLFAAILLAAVLPSVYFFFVPVLGEKQETLVGVVLAGVGVLALIVGVPMVAPLIVSRACRAMARPLESRWPFSGKMASRSMEQSPARVASSVAAVALVTAAFVGLEGMTKSLRAETEVWARSALVSKVFVQGLPGVDYEALRARLHEDPEVVAVESLGLRHFGTFDVVGLRADELARFGPCAEDPQLLEALEQRQGILVSSRLAEHLGHGVGDEVHVKTSGTGTQTFPVVGVTDAYGYSPYPDERMYGVVSDRAMERYFCLDPARTTGIAVTMKGPPDAGAVENAVRELAPEVEGLTIRTGEELLAFQLFDITRDFLLFDILFGLTAILAGLGVLNGQLLAAMERTKELGVLRALGASRGQVAGMVFLECAVVGACGGALGLLVGGTLTPVIVEALQVISGLPLPHRTAGAWLGVCLLGALLLSLLSGIYPVWRMNRFDAVRAVRTG